MSPRPLLLALGLALGVTACGEIRSINVTDPAFDTYWRHGLFYSDSYPDGFDDAWDYRPSAQQPVLDDGWDDHGYGDEFNEDFGAAIDEDGYDDGFGGSFGGDAFTDTVTDPGATVGDVDVGIDGGGFDGAGFEGPGAF